MLMHRRSRLPAAWRTASPPLHHHTLTSASTPSQNIGFYEPSRLVLYLCHKNSSSSGISITQTETQPESVRPWEIERPRDLVSAGRHASFCVVPEGKIGGYGHRAIGALLLGCVPLVTKEAFSANILEEAIDWAAIALHVPPAALPALVRRLDAADADALRRAAGAMRRRLLWTSIYGGCGLADGAGGAADAFDTLMQVLRAPRRHFVLSAAHRAPRAPELHRDLGKWLHALPGGARCAHNGQLGQ